MVESLEWSGVEPILGFVRDQSGCERSVCACSMRSNNRMAENPHGDTESTTKKRFVVSTSGPSERNSSTKYNKGFMGDSLSRLLISTWKQNHWNLLFEHRFPKFDSPTVTSTRHSRPSHSRLQDWYRHVDIDRDWHGNDRQRNTLGTAPAELL